MSIEVDNEGYNGFNTLVLKKCGSWVGMLGQSLGGKVGSKFGSECWVKVWVGKLGQSLSQKVGSKFGWGVECKFGSERWVKVWVRG